jgi:hypothetical protein
MAECSRDGVLSAKTRWSVSDLACLLPDVPTVEQLTLIARR